MIVVYADETGTGGIPTSGKEPAPGICGLLATPEMWDNFRVLWKAKLNQYGVKYFHFRELDKGARFDERLKLKNPYYCWDDNKVDDFIYDMAIVASGGPVPFGGNVSVKLEYGNNPTKENYKERYQTALECFFDDFGNQMNLHFPQESGKVSFYFAENENKDWTAILKRVIKRKRKMDPRIGEDISVEPKLERGMPCQAADLFAYINRQNNETVYEKRFAVPLRILDIIVSRYGFPAEHPFRELREMDENKWVQLVCELRGFKKVFDMQQYLAGQPKQQYYPVLEHPYFNYLWNRCLEKENKDLSKFDFEKFRRFARTIVSAHKPRQCE